MSNNWRKINLSFRDLTRASTRARLTASCRFSIKKGRWRFTKEPCRAWAALFSTSRSSSSSTKRFSRCSTVSLQNKLTSLLRPSSASAFLLHFRTWTVQLLSNCYVHCECRKRQLLLSCLDGVFFFQVWFLFFFNAYKNIGKFFCFDDLLPVWLLSFISPNRIALSELVLI